MTTHVLRAGQLILFFEFVLPILKLPGEIRKHWFGNTASYYNAHTAINKHVSLLGVKILRLQRGLSENPLQHNFLFIVVQLEATANIKRSRTSHEREEKM